MINTTIVSDIVIYFNLYFAKFGVCFMFSFGGVSECFIFYLFMLFYFLWLQYLGKYLSVGPPVYFVLKGGLNFSNLNDQNKVCGTVDCDSNSLAMQVYYAAHRANR